MAKQKLKNVGEAFKEGQQLTKEMLGDEGLRKTEALNTVMEKRKQNLEGFDQKEMSTMKNQMARQMLQREQQASQQLGASLGGAKGAGAAAQKRQLMEAGMQGRANIERDLFLKQEAAKRAALDKYEDTAQFDVSQKGKEIEFQTTMGLGLEGIQAQKEATQAEINALEASKKKKGGLGGAIGSALGAAGAAAFGLPPSAGAAVGGSIGSAFD